MKLSRFHYMTKLDVINGRFQVFDEKDLYEG